MDALHPPTTKVFRSVRCREKAGFEIRPRCVVARVACHIIVRLYEYVRRQNIPGSYLLLLVVVVVVVVVIPLTL